MAGGCKTVDSDTGMVMFLFGLLFIALLVLILRPMVGQMYTCPSDTDSSTSTKDGFLLNYPTVGVLSDEGTYGTPPPLGDFLPTDGDVATGDGGKYELESDEGLGVGNYNSFSGDPYGDSYVEYG